MKREDAFIRQFLGDELESLNIGEPEQVKTLLACIGLETLNKVKASSYTETDLKKMAGWLTSGAHQGVVPAADRRGLPLGEG